MEIKKALPGTQAFRDVKELYYSAFLSEERLPFSRMALLSTLKPSVDLLAYYDGETFCGFSFTVCTDQYLYVDFFAVNPKLRGKGYGSRMIADLLARYPVPAIGEAKAPDPNSPEYELEKRRIAFWKRAGFDFFNNEIIIYNDEVPYIVNSTKPPYDREAYWAIFDHLSFGPKSQLRILKRWLKRK